MANEKLSALVEANIEHLTEMWMQAVRSDARIDSDAALSRPELRDHVPAIIEELCELLRSDETPSPTNTLEGRVKVYLRFQQGYRGRELAREVSLLRTKMLDFLADRCADPLMNVDLKAYYSAARIINLYMDEILINAISAYSEAA
ncbi:MAG: RsbRD N-terminal domain-containing protein [Candidatus Manganitrophus sp.]|nr:RsbRD N-terminal domain-containing protein [Candidatus Manganitrophus sp.]MDC4223084.1 RsbRD N-terminal domain-containing protein [Candidatus Manganitrophus sp.]WDT69982.1 MAG: RsbRD N-terminal domain-containing protein [Candidatus Manganitrophus sp.]WDT78373.1 MAG: RsbRD N-terminal domain-containing protein [Candidatus Manganitrophus sp.]